MAEVEAENLVNNLIDDKSYEKAMEVVLKYNSSNLIKAKQAEILFKKGQYE
jgi:hypothetical protein